MMINITAIMMIIVGFMNTISITAIHLVLVLNNGTGGTTCALTLCKGHRTQKPGIVKEYNGTTMVIIITKENNSLQMGK